MYPVILSGGSGTRLWPQSRSMYPKQLLPLVSPDVTMLQATASRLNGIPDLKSPIVICNEEHRFLVAEQLRSIDNQAHSIVLEPCGRNTAPAIALAALSIEDPEELILVLPADHEIENVEEFHKSITIAREYALKNKLVTFGIKPSKAETGYGYIQSGESLCSAVYTVKRFVEKPDRQTAQQYLQEGNYSWNSGMFLFKASCYLDELSRWAPTILKQCKKALQNTTKDLDFTRLCEQAFVDCPDDSIDYAVMEKTESAVVIPIDIGWSDVGSWSALWEVSEKDVDGNAITGDVIVDRVKNCFIRNDKKLIAAVGVEDIVLVETDDSILLANKNTVQDVKSIVKVLKSQERPEADLHRKVFRPWGYYDSIENGKNFQVKRLAVYPGAKLSLQRHQHRAEHWVVVKGRADVVNGDKRLTLKVNESTYIPIGAVHQLGNSSDELLEIIEVQSGNYLGEDDIERLEDVYGRT